MRKKLIEAIKAAFLSEGYGFFQGFADKIQGSELTLPALWLTPIEVAGMSGRNDGKVTYKIVLYLFVQNEQYDEQQKEEKWEKLERIARKGIATLPIISDVISTDKVTIKPDEFALTSFGELSQTVTFLADVYFCNE